MSMTEDMAIHICLNPHGYDDEEIREARLTVCNRLEMWKASYENMRQFAIDSGLDTAAHNR